MVDFPGAVKHFCFFSWSFELKVLFSLVYVHVWSKTVGALSLNAQIPLYLCIFGVKAWVLRV